MLPMMSVQEPSSGPNEEKVLPVSLFESFCQCQVCFMNFNETTKIAKMLHCGHTFCNECIANVQKYGNSAHLECPTCRSETKCQFGKIPTNFLVMDMIRQIGLMGVAVTNPTSKEPKLTRGDQRERTIDEMVDDKYRHVIADIKGVLIPGFEGLKEYLRKSTIESGQRELDRLGKTIKDAIRDGYEYSESFLLALLTPLPESGIEENEIVDEEVAMVVEFPDGEVVRISNRNTAEAFIRRHFRFIRAPVLPILDTATTVENPPRSSSSESPEDDENGSDGDNNDDSIPTTNLTILSIMPLAILTAIAVNLFLNE